MGRPPSSLRVRADVVETRRKALRLAQKELGVAARTYRAWLGGESITLERAEDLARRLGLGIAEIVDGLPEGYVSAVADGDEDVPEYSRQLRDLAIEGGLLRESGKFLGYLRHIRPRFVPLRGYARYFQHIATSRHFYAEIVLSPSDPGEEMTYIFSFKLGPLRIDYGQIHVRDGWARLRTNFAASSSRPVRLIDPARIRVWTWFGRDACDFLVRSRRDFSIDTDLRPANRDPDQLPPGVLCFRAAPHHEPAAGGI